MATDLHPDHPDAQAVPGDKTRCGNREYTFGANQYTKFWRAGPKDGTIVCSSDYPETGPYLVNGKPCNDFPTAAARAVSGARAEYERALEVVRRYEKEEKPAK